MGQFSGLFNELETDKATSKPAKSESTNSKKKANVKTNTVKSKPQIVEQSQPVPSVISKRNHPDYTQALALVRKDTHKAVKIALLKNNNEQDYSDLIESLLQDWLRKQAA